jgi:hypothetical protein
MKTINSFFSALKATIQLLSGNYNDSSKYSFQPLPSYWQMSPASREGFSYTTKN